MVRNIKFKDGKRKSYRGIFYDAICSKTDNGELCIYLQQRIKKYKSSGFKVNEIFIPISKVKSMF